MIFKVGDIVVYKSKYRDKKRKLVYKIITKTLMKCINGKYYVSEKTIGIPYNDKGIMIRKATLKEKDEALIDEI